MNRSRFLLLAFGLVLSLAGPVHAEETVYAVDGGKLASIVVKSSTDVEDIVTTTHAVTGSITADRQKQAGSVTLSVKADTLDTGIPLRNEHLQGEGWLDVKKYPEITFKSTSVKHLKGDEYEIEGDFTMKGVTKKVVAKATVTFKDDEKAQKVLGGPAVKAVVAFSIKLSDYGITQPVISAVTGKVSDVLEVTVSLFGVNKPEPAK